MAIRNDDGAVVTLTFPLPAAQEERKDKS